MLVEMLLDVNRRLLDGVSARTVAAPNALAALLDELLRFHIGFALRQRLYVEEWVTVLTEIFPGATQVRMRAAAHATYRPA
jgi:hypothetical protein